MGIKNILKIAIYNLVQRRKTTIKIVVGFILVCILFVTVFSYNVAVDRQFEELVYVRMSSNYVEIEYEGELPDENIDYFESIEGVNQIRTIGRGYLDVENYQVYLDEKRYDFKSDVYLISVENGEIISKNEYTEFKYRFPNEHISYGTLDRKENEIVVNYRFVHTLGLSVNDVLGKTLNMVYTSGGTTQERLVNMKIVGVLSDAQSNLYSTYWGINFFVNQDLSKHIKRTTYIYLNNFKTGIEIYEKIKHSLEGVITAEIGYLGYSGKSLIESFAFLENQRNLVNRIMGVIGLLLLIALVINIITILLYDVKRKGIYFGVMKAEGMTDWNSFMIIFTELIMVFSVAVVVSMFVSAELIELIGQFTFSTTRISLTLNLSDYTLIGLGVFLGGAVFLLILSMILIRIHIKRDVVRLL
ncbi:MAG: hypothetical protein LBQ27_02210 [Clostridiales bacterium]|jgi:hypothetical protein|nr:hypothetical protein [Clostridiales bacterium]